MSKTSEKIRIEWKAADAKRDEGLTTPNYIVRYDDICYGSDQNWQKLDIYCDKNAKGKQPVIVNIHGGGWVYGNKEIYQFYCMELVKFGFTVVNFNYRLAPEFKFPANLEDTNLVMEFIANNSQKYNFDLENIFAVGDSAGGNILGLYSCFLTNETYRKNFDFAPAPVKLRAVGLNCGAYKLLTKENLSGNNELMTDLFTNGGTQEELKMIDVVSWITKDFPPAYIMTGSADFLAGDALPMANELLKNLVPFEIKFWSDPNPQNTCYHVFHVNCRHPLANECNRLECEFFKRNIFNNL